MDRIPALHVSLHLALINSYRLLATTQIILRAVELAPGQRTKIYLFIRCTRLVLAAAGAGAGSALSAHAPPACTSTTHAHTQVTLHSRTRAAAKFQRLTFEASNEAWRARARRSAAGGERLLPPARLAACDQLFALKLHR
ncbi:unnamed protein product [Spodoptera exigua]|nr:unnamed protein product [Spodoptera exigua]